MRSDYTHVYIEGDAYTPQRFWTRIFLKESDVKKFEGKTGYVRELTEQERINK